jgi:uncharacterized protein (DUF1330 family)
MGATTLAAGTSRRHFRDSGSGRTRDAAELELYAKQAPEFLKGYTINFLARSGQCEVKEGPGVESAAILEFPSMEEARNWYESPAYQAASQHRFKGGDYSAIIVEGGSSY